MKRNAYLTLALLVTGAVLVGVALWQLGGAGSAWQYAGYLGVALVLVGAGEWAWHSGLWRGGLIGGLGNRLGLGAGSDDSLAEVARLRDQLDTQRELLQRELRQELQRLDQRERQLADRLVAFHQWSEFPEPLPEGQEVATAEPMAELAAKDRRMLALLERESERLFEDIKRNKYSVDGKFQLTLARDDAYELVRKVAAIYQGEDIENPLLQTSLAQVMRSSSRMSLHFLVLLEQLPLKVQDYSIHRLYGYVRQGVKAYEMYKVAEPYWNNWVKPGFFLGRLAMGANPLVLGAWWFVGALSSQGATALTQRIVNRQAMLLLYNVVRVIGFEVASLYGGQFRHRDANWAYAAELTEMLHCFQQSHASLAQALREVGALQLRNEYDRVHLYRCLGEHRSAEPRRMAAAECLTVEQRQAVAHRLERFFQRFVRDRSPSVVRRWREGVQQRLQVPLSLDEAGHQPSAEEQRAAALRSLAGFLLAIKNVEPDQIAVLLAKCRLYRELSSKGQHDLLQGWREQPPLDFEPADLAEDSPLVGHYLDDLAELAVVCPPRDPETEALVLSAAVYVGKSEAAMRQKLDARYRKQLSGQVPVEAQGRKLPAEVARATLDLLEDGESLRLIYGGIQVEIHGAGKVDTRGVQSMWLVGTQQRLIAFSLEAEPRLIWRGDPSVRAERVKGYVAHDCRLQGGQWLDPRFATGATLRVPGRLRRRYASFFAPLLAFCKASSGGEIA